MLKLGMVDDLAVPHDYHSVGWYLNEHEQNGEDGANIPHGHILPLWMRDFTQEKGGITWNMGILLISKHWGYKQEKIRKWGAKEKSWGNNYRTLGILTIKNSAAYAAAETTISSHPYGKLPRSKTHPWQTCRTHPEQSNHRISSLQIDSFFQFIKASKARFENQMLQWSLHVFW